MNQYNDNWQNEQDRHGYQYSRSLDVYKLLKDTLEKYKLYNCNDNTIQRISEDAANIVDILEKEQGIIENLETILKNITNTQGSVRLIEMSINEIREKVRLLKSNNDNCLELIEIQWKYQKGFFDAALPLLQSIDAELKKLNKTITDGQ